MQGDPKPLSGRRRPHRADFYKELANTRKRQTSGAGVQDSKSRAPMSLSNAGLHAVGTLHAVLPDFVFYFLQCRVRWLVVGDKLCLAPLLACFDSTMHFRKAMHLAGPLERT